MIAACTGFSKAGKTPHLTVDFTRTRARHDDQEGYSSSFVGKSTLLIPLRNKADTSVRIAMGLAESHVDMNIGNDGVIDPTFWQTICTLDSRALACVRTPFDRLPNSWTYCANTPRRSLEDCLCNPSTTVMSSTASRELNRPPS